MTSVLHVLFQQKGSDRLRGRNVTAKVCKLLDQAFAAAWKKEIIDTTSLGIVKKLLSWDNFLLIWQYFSKYIVRSWSQTSAQVSLLLRINCRLRLKTC